MRDNVPRMSQPSIPRTHTETSAGRCCICGTAWPCVIWVAEREAYDAEPEWIRRLSDHEAAYRRRNR